MNTTHTQHTPGPWSRSAGRIQRVTGGLGANDGGLVFELVATINEGNDNSRANARLITAAPELVEALRGMLAADDAICENIGRKSDQAMNRIAAIDKARALLARIEGGAE